MPDTNKNTPAKTCVRVMTWNLWWQFGPWQDRAAAILSTLQQTDADVIALQEVWDDGNNNFAAQLAENLGFYYTYAPGAQPNGIHMGNAILSRWPIKTRRITALYDQPDTPEMRVALYTEIDGPRGPLPVFSTHLNWQQQHSHIRQRQIADLTRFIHDQRPWSFPPILCGDFNADPQSHEIRMLTGQTTCPTPGLVFHDAWAFKHPADTGFTWDNTNPFAAQDFGSNRRIDYIFTGFPRARGAGHIQSCQITGNHPVKDIWPSDHFALMAELRY